MSQFPFTSENLDANAILDTFKGEDMQAVVEELTAAVENMQDDSSEIGFDFDFDYYRANYMPRSYGTDSENDFYSTSHWDVEDNFPSAALAPTKASNSDSESSSSDETDSENAFAAEASRTVAPRGAASDAESRTDPSELVVDIERREPTVPTTEASRTPSARKP